MWDRINTFLQLTFLSNSLGRYIGFAVIILLGIFFKRLLARAVGYILYRAFRKQAATVGINQFYQLTKKSMGMFLLLIFVYIACDLLSFPASWNLAPANEFGLRMILFMIWEILLLSCIIWIALKIVDFIGLILLARAAKDDSSTNDQLIPFAMDVIKVVVATLGIFLILGTVFHLNVGSLIAGLGIGGLAIALAAKDTLENLFGSFTIFADKPFKIGDLIKIGEITGTVEKIGFRSTRLRTFEQSYVTIPNKKMIEAELENLTMRTSMRSRHDIPLAFTTPPALITSITQKIEQHLSQQKNIQNDYVVKLNNWTESSLQIYILYYIRTNDWNEYMKIREQIGFSILEIVHSEGMEFAIPGQRIRLEK